MFLIIAPVYWVCCEMRWEDNFGWVCHCEMPQCTWREENCARKFPQYLLFSDLILALFFVPFSNVDFYILGGWWYAVLIIRLMFCAVTFYAAVMVGMHFACGCKLCYLSLIHI